MTALFVFAAHAHLKTTPAKVRSRDGLSQNPAYVLKRSVTEILCKFATLCL